MSGLLYPPEVKRQLIFARTKRAGGDKWLGHWLDSMTESSRFFAFGDNNNKKKKKRVRVLFSEDWLASPEHVSNHDNSTLAAS